MCYYQPLFVFFSLVLCGVCAERAIVDREDSFDLYAAKGEVILPRTVMGLFDGSFPQTVDATFSVNYEGTSRPAMEMHSSYGSYVLQANPDLNFVYIKFDEETISRGDDTKGVDL